ncbi:hypothetical protein ACQKP0_08510 [Heyndrickxia sp. NPDC080065]|uniref:hypothetical protein n=1 Tax=Heyndrickxia sp. NPDC080065 TaxID=3390568 RepID=UPI003D03AB24
MKKYKETTAFIQNRGTYVRKYNKLTHFCTNNGTGVRQTPQKLIKQVLLYDCENLIYLQ